MAKQNVKNTLQNTSLTKPLSVLIPPRPPQFKTFQKPVFGKQQLFNTSFRTQSKGGGGK
jgi:hypothetical protein